MRAATIGLLVLCVARPVSAQGAGRVRGWSSDATAYLNALATQHYVLRQNPLPDSIRTAAARYRANVARWSDDRALAELMRIAAMAGDGHTYVLPFGAAHVQTHMVPVRLYEFSDGMFVIDALPGFERLIGARVQALAGVPARQFRDRLQSYVPRDNDPGGLLFGVATLIRYQGFIEAAADRSLGDSVDAVLALSGGGSQTIRLPFVPGPPLSGVPKLIPSRIATAPAPLWLRHVPTTFWFEPIGDTVLYVQFNQVMNTPQESLREAAGRLDHSLQARHPRLLIVDVRHNNGGNLTLLDPLITVLSSFTGAGGRLVVISGRHTFSAAQVFLARAEHEAHAQIAGEISGSKPNFVGEENPVTLPWSGALASVSNQYHESIPGDARPWIEPRPKIYLSSADYFANRDPVLEAILAGR